LSLFFVAIERSLSRRVLLLTVPRATYNAALSASRRHAAVPRSS